MDAWNVPWHVLLLHRRATCCAHGAAAFRSGADSRGRDGARTPVRRRIGSQFIYHISNAISVNHIVDRIARETELVIDELMPELRKPFQRAEIAGSFAGPLDVAIRSYSLRLHSIHPHRTSAVLAKDVRRGHSRRASDRPLRPGRRRR